MIEKRIICRKPYIAKWKQDCGKNRSAADAVLCVKRHENSRITETKRIRSIGMQQDSRMTKNPADCTGKRIAKIH